MSRRIPVFFCVALIGAFFFAIGARAAEPALDIYWIDVEGGGATLIVTPAQQSILIDTGWAKGPSAARIHEVATQVAGLRKIDYLIMTHFHADHYGGAAGLAGMMPIVNVYDNGIPGRNPDGAFDGGAFSTLIEPYRDFKAEHRAVIEPGQAVALSQQPGTAALSLRCMGARCQFFHGPHDPANPHCASGTAQPFDKSDNKNSIVSLVQFGPFKFFDGGDLTWNMEKELVCPVNSIGQVDIYQTDNHGTQQNSNPVLLTSLAPTVSVMNNGPHKGGSLPTLATLRTTPSIQTMYQVHKDLRGGKEYNTDDEFIANLEEKCSGNFIKCSVAASGKTYTISIPARKFSRTYQTKTP